MTRIFYLVLAALSLTVPTMAEAVPRLTIDNVSTTETAGKAQLRFRRTQLNGQSTWIRVRTIEGSAKANTDFVPLDIQMELPASARDVYTDLQLVNDQDPEAVETVTVQATILSNGRCNDCTSVITITDSDAPPPVLEPTPTTEPTPVPTTEPTPTPTPVPTTSGLTGETPIPSNFDPNLAVIAQGGTPGSDGDVVGAFRFLCGAGQLSNDDPILFPGQPGKAHLHQFFGNVEANANSTYSSLRLTGDSTCNWTGQGIAANRSAYWMPALLDGKGNVVRPDYVTIYYKQRPQTDPEVNDPGYAKYQGKAVQLPNGLKFIFGFDPTGINQIKTGGFWFNCDPAVNIPWHSQDMRAVLAACPAGSKFGAIIEAPDCWDGKNLDSPDHRSHVAYSSYGTWGYLKCPTTHPYVIPTFQMGAWYPVVAGDDVSRWSFSSDAMTPDKPAGNTFHADFFMAWDPVIHNVWYANCIQKRLSCSGGQLGDGRDLKGAAFHNLKRDFRYSTRLVPLAGNGLNVMGQ